jgi:hypothetical protein
MFVLLSLAGCLVDRALYESRTEALTDHDGDGFAQEDDCDDGDVAVFPGAVEVCDAVDQDCDGLVDEDASDAPSWYPDADADGHGILDGAVASCVSPGGAYSDLHDDCDDTSASAWPGAEETAYDGVDQDCDGADLDDLDGDGWTSALTGGQDCDDADAQVNPDAEETWANGVTDNDCDGEIEPIQLDFGADAWFGSREGDGLGRRVAALGDIDQDGFDDIVIGSEVDSTVAPSSGALYRVDGPAGGSLATAPSLFPVDGGQMFAAGVDAGTDLTGDGVGDLLVSAMGTPTTIGVAWLVDGAAWVASGSATIDQVEAGEVRASTAGTFGPAAVRFVGDVTGDGVDDVALGECCAGGTVGRVAVVSSDAFTGTLDDADVVIDGPWTDAYFGYGVDRIGDQDGDGLPELLVSGGGGLVGAVVPGTTGGDVLRIATTLLYGEVEGTSVRNIRDVDGDGDDDLAVVGQDNLVSFFTALGSAPTRVLETPTFTFTWEEHGGAYDVLPVEDLDGDGRAEVLVPEAWSDSGAERIWMVMGADVQYGASLDAGSVTLSGAGVVPDALFGYSVARGGDVDGDGQEDIVVGAPNYAVGGQVAGGATLLPLPR